MLKKESPRKTTLADIGLTGMRPGLPMSEMPPPPDTGLPEAFATRPPAGMRPKTGKMAKQKGRRP